MISLLGEDEYQFVIEVMEYGLQYVNDDLTYDGSYADDEFYNISFVYKNV
ncbi:MAG: hypothetical protein FWG90_05010 [Oscillospiraceae bacterium]|nr:hypothetical protein [Oscillospiraceae bacterium]